MSKTYLVSIVDDHTMFRKGLTALINMFPDYEVLFDAANGKDFIAQINPDQLPDIVLLDITMPEMDGYETAEWIRVNFPSIYVLALSTMDSDAAILKMIRHGARGYLLKDADTSELRLAFQEVLAKGYFYNESLTRKVLQSLPDLVNDQSEVALMLKLTQREIQFIKLACSEKTYADIAAEMFLSERTIDGYRDALFKKLNVGSRVGLVLFAIKNKLAQV